MEELNRAWADLILAMLNMSDKASDADIEIFNTHAKAINDRLSWFQTYHMMKE